MVKKYPKKIFVISAVIAVAVFIAGILLGISIDDLRIKDLVDSLKQSELDTESYLIEQDFIKNFGGNSCKLTEPRLNALSKELGVLGTLLTKYESKKLFDYDEYLYIKQKYFLLEIKTYSFLNKFKKECGGKFNTILFFYEKDEDSSKRQGYILDSLVRNNEDLYIFSIDKSFDKDPILETVKLHYNITMAPTLIVNNEFRIEGIGDIDRINSLIR